jgi:serine/threonine-protein kinase
MAPEIALGRADVDPRADIYALGCVAYFLLTGTVVFPDENPMSMALKQVQETPDPPSSRTEVPIAPDLAPVVRRWRATGRAARPAPGREVADLLAACALPPWTAEDAAAWWERHLPPTSTLRTSALPPSHTPPIVQKI